MNALSPYADTRQHILSTARRIIGARGFTAVGLNEILKASDTPKGSFYHYFASKEAFGETLLEQYFAGYLLELDALIAGTDGTAAERLIAYWENWRRVHVSGEPHEHCLSVKLGAEVCDLSEGMRAILRDGTASVMRGLARFIAAGQRDGSLTVTDDAQALATALYQLWLGATLLAKFRRDADPFDAAMKTTRQMLGLPNTNSTSLKPTPSLS